MVWKAVHLLRFIDYLTTFDVDAQDIFFAVCFPIGMNIFPPPVCRFCISFLGFDTLSHGHRFVLNKSVFCFHRIRKQNQGGNIA